MHTGTALCTAGTLCQYVWRGDYAVCGLPESGYYIILTKSTYTILENSCLPFLYSGHTSGFHNSCLSGMQIPEETTYFKPKSTGVYSGIFWLMFIINFLAPLLILMRRGAKRNYSTVTFMAMLIILEH